MSLRLTITPDKRDCPQHGRCEEVTRTFERVVEQTGNVEEIIEGRADHVAIKRSSHMRDSCKKQKKTGTQSHSSSLNLAQEAVQKIIHHSHVNKHFKTSVLKSNEAEAMERNFVQQQENKMTTFWNIMVDSCRSRQNQSGRDGVMFKKTKKSKMRTANARHAARTKERNQL